MSGEPSSAVAALVDALRAAGGEVVWTGEEAMVVIPDAEAEVLERLLEMARTVKSEPAWLDAEVFGAEV